MGSVVQVEQSEFKTSFRCYFLDLARHVSRITFHTYVSRIIERLKSRNIAKQSDASKTQRIHHIASGYYFFQLP